MTDTAFNIQKLTAVPQTPTTPSTVFLVALPDKTDHFEMYVSSRDGTTLKRHINEADIKALIAQSATQNSKYVVVADIAERDRLSDKTSAVYVKNATADRTVKRGGAFYLYDTNAWIKVSEAESMDLNLDWASLTGKPTSSVGAIDTAVQKAHSHANATQLDKIGEESGKLTYGGKLVATTINDAW